MNIAQLTGPSSSAIEATDPSNKPVRTVKQKTLGQDDFLKLLAVQYKNQDPNKPMDDTATIAQMAQFSALEQTTQLNKNQQLTTANSYLGHRVTVTDENGATQVGDVSAINSVGGTPQLVVGGKNYAISSVLRVEPSYISTNPTTLPVTSGGV